MEECHLCLNCQNFNNGGIEKYRSIKKMNKLCSLVSQYLSDSDSEGVQEEENTKNDVKRNLKDSIEDIEELPVTDWSQCIDNSTGHPYYWNMQTKEVTWERPLEYKQYIDSIQKKLHKLPNNCWIIGYTDDNNKPFYVNEYTRVVVWDKPQNFIEKPLINIKKAKKKEKHKRNKESKLSKKIISKKVVNNCNDEKIELKSSYSPSGGSSSEEEKTSKRKSSKNKREVKTNQQVATTEKFNLVSAYDVESESDDQEKNASSSDLIEIKNSPNLLDKLKSKSSSPIRNIKEATFASIITGGQLNNPIDEELEKLKEELEKDLKALESPKDDKIEIDNTNKKLEQNFDEKTFHRKRRIEINSDKSKAFTKERIPRPGFGFSDKVSNECDKKFNNNSSVNNLYPNFFKSHTEFLNETELIDEPEHILTKNDKQTNKNDIQDLCELIENKVKFLCSGKAEVSTVQIISIQLQTLLMAYYEKSLNIDYFSKWLKTTADDLNSLEKNAAPVGWECKWDRKNSKYCYTNLVTGDIQWEFPEDDEQIVDPKYDEDKMDISTTPPPNEHEQLAQNIASWDAENPPPPPVISFDKPQIQNELTNKAVDINLELEIFYSDIASINDVTTCTKNTENTKINDDHGIIDINKQNKEEFKDLNVRNKENSILTGNLLKETIDNKNLDNENKILSKDIFNDEYRTTIENENRKRINEDDLRISKKKSKKIKVQGLNSKMKEVTSMVAKWQKAQQELDDEEK